MKFFKHFKNKPYKFIGLAKHSETQEDFVLYETRYENANSKLWVRPKEMFFENVTKDGQTFPRFKNIPLEVVTKTQFGEAEKKEIEPLFMKVLQDQTPEALFKIKDTFDTYYLLLGYFEKKLVGFKLGFRQDRDTFRSWLGGVDPEFRGLGVAATLMTLQHEWCREQKYKSIETRTKNRYKEMLILDLKFGFDIKGSFTDKTGEAKIILEKKL